MHRKIFLFLFLFSSGLLFSSGDSLNFFRSQSVYSNDTTLVYDQLSWKLRLDGPVRASAAYGKGMIFIGTARGTFYAFDEKTGTERWKFNAGAAIHSTAAYENGKVWFITNRQELICLDATNGKKIWSLAFGKRLDYQWRYDYWYSSPVINGKNIYAGADDGKVYCISKTDGKQIWVYDAHSVVRSTPVFDEKKIYFGDCSGLIHAIGVNDGKMLWTAATVGYTVQQDSFIYDRKAVLSSVALSDTVLIAGGRDGFLYGFSRVTGKKIWQDDFSHSWVNSSAAIKNKMAITGTSDGRFVGAFDVYTGREKWKHETRNIVWSSPIVIGHDVYAADCEGILHVLDCRSGKKISEYRTVNAAINIFSSPVYTGSSVVFGTDEGDLFVLSSRKKSTAKKLKFVFWKQDVPFYFRNGMDIRVRDYFADNGYTLIDSSRLVQVFGHARDSAAMMEIVFATNYFPDTMISGKEKSMLRNFLEYGGTMLLMGPNPAVYDFSNSSFKYNFTRVESVFGIHYGPDDLRSHRGIFPVFATETGRKIGFPDFSTAIAPVDKNLVDAVFAMDENGFASSWIKYYGKEKKGKLIQVYVDAKKPEDLNYLKLLGSWTK